MPHKNTAWLAVLPIAAILVTLSLTALTDAGSNANTSAIANSHLQIFSQASQDTGHNTCSVTSDAGSNFQCQISQSVVTQPGTELFPQGSQSQQSVSNPADSPVAQVNTYNTNNAWWFLTCPLDPYRDPNPTGQAFFYTGLVKNVLGNACTQSPTLTSSFGLNTYTSWNDNSWPISTVSPGSINNAAYLVINDIAYSREVQDGNTNTIANGYSSNSYIFQQIPSDTQQAIWTWSGVIANFSQNWQQQELPLYANTVVSANYITQGSVTWNLEVECTKYSCPTPPAVGPCTPYQTLCSSSTTSNFECQWPYTYSENTIVTDVHNSYIPFEEVNPFAATTSFFNANAVPFLTYNYQIKTLGNLNLSGSQDIFSPWNYYTPQTSEDMLPLNLPGIFLFNHTQQQNKYVLDYMPSNQVYTLYTVPNTNSQVSLTPVANITTAVSSSGAVPQVVKNNIVNPISIAATPNNYIYVLNQSTNGDYVVYIFRLVPQGDYNLSNYQPSLVSSESTQQEAISAWKQYWSNVITLQNFEIYNVSVIDITQLMQNENMDTHFGPLNISVDSSGDLFIAGYYDGNSAQYRSGGINIIGSQSGNPEIIEITNTTAPNPSSSPEELISMTPNCMQHEGNCAGIPALSEIAVSPDGQQIFAANPFVGTVYEFGISQSGCPSGENTCIVNTGAFNLAFGATPETPGPGFSSQYTSQGVQLSSGATVQSSTIEIAQYLQYLINKDPSLSSAAQISGYDLNSLDTANNHHPLALADVNGYLYVLDNWYGSFSASFNTGQQPAVTIGQRPAVTIPLPSSATMPVVTQQGCPFYDQVYGTCPGETSGSSQQSTGSSQQSTGTMYFNTVFLRVFNSTGGEIPINSTQTNDVYLQHTCAPNFNTNNYEMCGAASTSGATFPSPSLIDSNGNPAPSPQAGLCSGGSVCVPTSTGGQCTYAKDPSASYDYSCRVSTLLNSNLKTSNQYYLPGSQDINNAYPPYGWLLSANVIYLSQGSTATPGTCDNNSCEVTFCSSSSCALNPASTETNAAYGGQVSVFENGYPPLGPNIQAINPKPPAGMDLSAEVNGSVQMLLEQSSVSASFTYTNLILANIKIANYTKVYTGGPTYTCFTNEPGAQTWGSSSVNQGCYESNFINSISAPIYLVGNPFAYVENLGSTQSYTLPGLLGSAEAAATAQGGAGTVNQLCAQNYVTNGSTNDISGCPAYTLNTILPSVPTPLQTPPAGQQTSLNSWISGLLVVPYAYTYETVASVTFPPSYSAGSVPTTVGPQPSSANPTCTPGSIPICNIPAAPSVAKPGYVVSSSLSMCPAPPTPTPSSIPPTTYYTYATASAESGVLTAKLEGGDTYFKNMLTDTLYKPNLTASIIPPQVFYNILTDRVLGSIGINVTGLPESSQPGISQFWPPEILGCSYQPQGPAGTPYADIPYEDFSYNAQAQIASNTVLNYKINQYTQLPGAGFSGFETVNAFTPPNTQPSLLSALVSFKYIDNGNQPVVPPQTEGLFDFYKSLAYMDSAQLQVASPQLLGFHLLSYTLNDRFNNTVYAPMPVDIANTVIIKLSFNNVVDQANSNQTNVYVTGNVYSISFPQYTATPLAGADIYLYYGADINYAHTTSPTQNAVDAFTDPVDAVLCAYGNPLIYKNIPQSCELANASYVGLTDNVNTITYAPSYNSSTTNVIVNGKMQSVNANQCNPAPTYLLAHIFTECNIYNIGSPDTCPRAGDGSQQFCQEINPSNGEGFCTSQIGLIPNSTPNSQLPYFVTNANGQFTASFTACGSGPTLGDAQLVAKYYGSPMQPTAVHMLPLYMQSNVLNGQAQLSAAVNEYEPSYTIEPNSTTAQFTIGLFELGYGNFGYAATALIPIIGIIMAMYGLLKKSRQKPRARKKA